MTFSSGLTVTWVPYDDVPDATNLGGMGGWFAHGHRWQDYLDYYKKSVHPHLEALRASIIEHGIWEHGGWHQDTYDAGTKGAPVFSDGVVATYTLRAWGDLLAAVWSTETDVDMCYMDFYYGDVRERPPEPRPCQHCRARADRTDSGPRP